MTSSRSIVNHSAVYLCAARLATPKLRTVAAICCGTLCLPAKAITNTRVLLLLPANLDEMRVSRRRKPPSCAGALRSPFGGIERAKSRANGFSYRNPGIQRVSSVSHVQNG